MDSLITNFHLPESTLIMLVSSLAGKEFVMKAYKKAVEEKYRFFQFWRCNANTIEIQTVIFVHVADPNLLQFRLTTIKSAQSRRRFYIYNKLSPRRRRLRSFFGGPQFILNIKLLRWARKCYYLV